VTHRHDDADPIEHDPTGMRALLGSLPDPGPMPEELVARITAALEEEARSSGAEHRRAPVPPVTPPADAQAPGDPQDPPGEVVPLHRGRGWQLLGAAAAAVVVLAAGGLVVEQLSPSGLEAGLGLANGAPDSAPADSAAADSAAGGDVRAEASGTLASDDTLHVVIVASGTDYTTADLADLASDLEPGTVTDPTAPDTGRLTAPDAPGGTVASPAGARACATVVGADPAEPLLVDLASFEGHRAAVVVATEPDGTRRAWVVERDCRVGAPGVLDGPVALS
jgi:hypothetical protein